MSAPLSSDLSPVQVAVRQMRNKFLDMSVEEKRKLYECNDNYIPLNSITSWRRQAPLVATRKDVNEKICLVKSDIIRLEVDAIVSASNRNFHLGGGVDSSIHSAAGSGFLQAECQLIGKCEEGDAVITGGYKLPAKYIIHTVTPFGEKQNVLEKCYTSCLDLARQFGLRSIAFPCIGTGGHRYPRDGAATVALSTVRRYLETCGEHFDRIIFCVFLDVDVTIYNRLLPVYFPDCQCVR